MLGTLTLAPTPYTIALDGAVIAELWLENGDAAPNVVTVAYRTGAAAGAGTDLRQQRYWDSSTVGNRRQRPASQTFV